MRLVLPYPISANRYWRTVVLRGQAHATTYVSKEAESYKRDVKIVAYDQGVREPITGRVAVTLQLYPHRPQDWERRVRRDPMNWDDTVQCLDLDNAQKVLFDALKGTAFGDDVWIRRIQAERMEPDESGARVVVTVESIARQAPQASLLDGLPPIRDSKAAAALERSEKVPF